MSTKAKRVKYNFSEDVNKSISLPISTDLHDRILVLCNITELTQTAMCRYILKRGITEMEGKLVAMAGKKATL